MPLGTFELSINKALVCVTLYTVTYKLHLPLQEKGGWKYPAVVKAVDMTGPIGGYQEAEVDTPPEVERYKSLKNVIGLGINVLVDGIG